MTEYIEYEPYILAVSNESLSKPYEKINEDRITRIEDNNLRLLSTELQFLNLYYLPSNVEEKSILIYIGAAPGVHLAKLIQCYPELEYHLYDSQPFSKELKEYSNNTDDTKIVFFEQNFGYDDISRYQGIQREIYVITDFENRHIPSDLTIKREPNKEIKSKLAAEKEKIINDDMLLQMEWMKQLRPKMAYLKFRLPHYYEGVSTTRYFEYFTGTVFKTIFSKSKTIECRLAVSDFDRTIKYNFKKFEEIMHYYNDITRESNITNPILLNGTPFGRYGNKFDILVFFWILKDYYITRGHLHPRASELIKLYEHLSV